MPRHSALRSLLLAAVIPAAASAQQPPPPKTPPRDTLTRAEREQLRETARAAEEVARRNLSGDTVARRKRAEAAAPTAFASEEARQILLRARAARLTQDSALKAYQATTTQRISVGMGVRRTGLEKLLFRTDNVARVSWREGVGARVMPIGSRMTIPMATQADGNTVEAVTVPYYPGRETLWIPGSGYQRAEAEIDERELIHPLASGAEAYYRYATGDSADIRLPDGRSIRLRELRITARKPQWRLFVGSFWFDRDGGQLVRAAYRLSVDIDIWDLVSEESLYEAMERPEIARVRDSIARVQLPRDLYVKDSTLRAERERNRKPGSRANDDEDAPAWVKATFRPAKAKLDGITVEYGLYQGRFWLPRAHSATASMQMAFIRTPFNFDEKFTYEQVNGDFSLKAIPTLAERRAADSAFRRDSAAGAEDAPNGSVTIGISSGKPDTSAVRRERRDSATLARLPRAQREQCRTDSTWTQVRERGDGALRIAYDMPCEMSKLERSPALPPAFAGDEELFDAKSRDELLGSLDMGLQPGFSPMPIKFHTGPDMLRYNRIEGLSVGATASSVLGAGYTVSALGRIGHADLHVNGELSLARSNGARTVTGTIYHRLAAANPEWGGALSLGPSLPAFLYARDEGFYYRNFGVELGEVRESRYGSLDYKLFVERQWTAGDSDVVNTFSLGRLIGDRRFRQNIQSEEVSITGVSGSFLKAFGSDPRGLRLLSTTRAEAATGTFEFARLSVEGVLSRPINRFAAALTASAGSSVGRLPVQRLWYMGGLRTVRGQIAGTQSGDAFWLARGEIGTGMGVIRPVGFFDIGWAGSRDAIGRTQPQRGAGIGIGLLDGLFRIDFSRGLYPNRKWRTDVYLGAPL